MSETEKDVVVVIGEWSPTLRELDEACGYIGRAGLEFSLAYSQPYGDLIAKARSIHPLPQFEERFENVEQKLCELREEFEQLLDDIEATVAGTSGQKEGDTNVVDLSEHLDRDVASENDAPTSPA